VFLLQRIRNLHPVRWFRALSPLRWIRFFDRLQQLREDPRKLIIAGRFHKTGPDRGPVLWVRFLDRMVIKVRESKAMEPKIGPNSIGDATEPTQIEHVEPAHNYLELQVLRQGQQEFRFPFIHSTIDFSKDNSGAFPPDTPWAAHLGQGLVELVNEESGERVPLVVSDSVELDGARIWLLDVRNPPVGTLHGVSAPFAGRMWNLDSQQTWLGRKGKRLNHIELAHPTVSRTHATFLPDRKGRVALLAESAAAPTSVNGQPLEVGVTHTLSNGDLLSFGELNFRFAAQIDAASQEALLSLSTLGTFQAQVGGVPVVSDITNEKVEWMLAALALNWGEPSSVESLMVWFWPEQTATRGRKNLSYTLRQLREYLNLTEENFGSLVLRTTTAVRLNPDRLDSHDYSQVKSLTQGHKPLTSSVALERLISLYQGRFLPTCYEDWAETARHTLEVDFCKTLTRSAEYHAERSDLATLRLATDKLLEIDPMNEEAVRLLMEGALAAGKPDIAIKSFEELTKTLKAEGLEPDTETLKVFYKAHLGFS
jgi:DNA-binding SARP family transcriptional activator